MNALVRREHPELGILEQGERFGLLEKEDLLASIEGWLLKEVCLQGRFWQERYADRFVPTASTNISSKRLVRSDLLEENIGTLEESGLAASHLTPEPSGDASIDDAEIIIGRLRELEALGVRVEADTWLAQSVLG